MKRIAILSSTNGSNLQSFIDARDLDELPGIDIACLITNKSKCGAREKAKKAGIPTHFISAKGKDRTEFDRQMLAILDDYQVDLVVLGGYMRIIGPEMVHRYKKRILNIHPSLLPKFAGEMSPDIYQSILDAGEKETGMTIHYVDEGVDTGGIVLQKSIPIAPNETVESLKNKIQRLEKEWYPKAVATLLSA